MSTITKELAKLFRKITNSEIDAEGNAHVVLSPADSLLINNARIALASLEAEPVAWAHRLINKRNGVVHPWVYGSAEACPSEGDIFNIEVMPLYTVPPAPVSVPAAMEMDDDFDSAFEHGKAVGWNAYRAAMLQAEPVSNSDELPLDYLQGHKDGLEWAAQLAEANHPQTGDWLYDDPIDLARAIRKGPDMPTVQGGNSPVIPDDVRRMDWLVSKTVDVREPMVYGSHSLFWSQTITDEEDDYHATKLREQIDAAMAAEQAAAPQQEAE
ncbi:DUF551 domain-containing protein [Escherichia coli]|uniref:DUF551 domain-containing protein n=1 Tax=Escherichia coli TaxID=562 RepID=UPI0011C7508E|nr:DUF551 domain-containing protein [Escherichia coli]TXP91724.1 DUF551 domain-containing protein [Escherichia coli]TXP96477.1 DUF551 domain-containing protein [Escherichia coli]